MLRFHDRLEAVLYAGVWWVKSVNSTQYCCCLAVKCCKWCYSCTIEGFRGNGCYLFNVSPYVTMFVQNNLHILSVIAYFTVCNQLRADPT